MSEERVAGEKIQVSRWRRVAALVMFAAVAIAEAAAAGRVQIVWPTPSEVWEKGRPANEFLQHAGSGEPASGGFGGVRSGGLQFHEGVDIKPSARDRSGAPTDSIFAAMDGVVRHVSAQAGNSSYGRYIVLEHPDESPAVYTLYAHLARISPGVRVGARVERGQTIGLMGHSSGGYMIPEERAHLHFEIGVMMTQAFQSWYDARKFGSRNEHGVWNGMNLMGVDPVDFMNDWRARRVNNFEEYFAAMEPVVRLRIATRRVPDFVQRYPALVKQPMPMLLGGWEIKFNWSGLPFEWTPLTSADLAGMDLNDMEIMEVNEAVERRQRSKILAVKRRGKWVPARDLNTVLQQLFGLR